MSLRVALWLALAGSALPAPAPPVRELEARVAAEPDNLQAKFALGKAFAQQGRSRNAIDLFEAILARRRAPTVAYLLGLEYEKVGETRKATRLWLEMVGSASPPGLSPPLAVLTMEHLAAALHAQGDLEQSLAWWRRVLEVDPAHETARRMSGVALYKLGRYREAAREWLLLLRSRPSRPVEQRALHSLALAFVKLDQRAKASQVVKRLLQNDSGHAEGLKLKAWLEATAPHPVPSASVRPGDEALRSTRRTGETTSPRLNESPSPPPSPPPPPTFQAETLFLDGLDSADKGHHEKALLLFLQALDLEPKFTQAYLKVGEVYLTLARLAPTRPQFLERIGLALQSLEKAAVLVPNSLLAHSARGRIVECRKLEKEGFTRFHMAAARQAIQQGRHRDAVDRCTLLLSNDVLQDAVFLDLAGLVSRLDRGTRQDLLSFLEDLAAKNPESLFVPYVLGTVYLSVGKAAEAKISLGAFVDRIGKLAPADPAAEAFVAHASAPQSEATNHYLLGCLLSSRRAQARARSALEEYVHRAGPDAPFHADALRKLRQLDGARGADAAGFDGERKELVAAVPGAGAVFGPDVRPPLADEKLVEELRGFVRGRPDNGLGRLLLAFALSERPSASGPVRAQDAQQAAGLFRDLTRERWSDPDWHYRVAVLALGWRAEDRCSAHLKVSGDILLATGRPVSKRHARMALDDARRLIAARRLADADLLLEQARVYDPECLSYHLVKYDLDRARGRFLGALWNLAGWAGKAFSSPWHRLLLLTNLGILSIQVVLLTLLGAAFALGLKYFDPLHHFFAEYLKRKGVVFSLPLAIVAGLALLPTGFVVVFPLLAWTLLDRVERQTYVALILLLLVLPLLLPISFEGNFQLIRMAEEFRGGNLEEAQPFFERALEQNEYDYVSRYVLGQIHLRKGESERAELHFAKLCDRNAFDVGALVNLGVAKAQQRDYKKALALLSQAVGRQAANLPALFDMSAIAESQGLHDKSQQYLRWAVAAARDPDQLPRYQAFTSDVPRLVLMDCPIDPDRLAGLFSFFSTANFFGFNAAVFRVLGWLLIGGGMLAWLILTWQRMDFSTSRCDVCLRVTCDQCQHGDAEAPLCPECASLPRMAREKRHALMIAAAQRLHGRMALRGRVANLLLPGSGLYFSGLAPVGAFIQALFLFLFLAWWQRGGTLLATIHQGPDLPILGLLLGLCLVSAMAVHGLAQLAYGRLEQEVRAP